MTGQLLPAAVKSNSKQNKTKPVKYLLLKITFKKGGGGRGDYTSSCIFLLIFTSMFILKILQRKMFRHFLTKYSLT